MRVLLPLAVSLALTGCSGAENGNTGAAANNRTIDSEIAGFEDPQRPVTINCDRARGQADQAICSDQELIALDRELAAMPSGAVDDRWIAQRGECGRSDDLRACLLDHYAARIADRLQSARTDGLINGPVAFRCGPEDLTATFINSDPGVVHLRAGTEAVTLPRVTAASGVKYEGRPDGQPWSFWNKGREATLIREGEEITCAEEAPAG